MGRSAWDRVLPRIGIGMAVAGVAALGLSAWIDTLFPSRASSAVGLPFGATLVVYILVGTFLVYRRPRNLVGWLLLLVGFFGGTDSFAADYARYGLFTSPGSLPGAQWLAWFAAWGFQPVLVAPALIMLLFPDGHVVSRRWRPLLWAAALVPLGVIVPQMLMPTLGFGPSDLHHPNPIGIPGTQHAMESVRDLMIPLVFGLLPLALVHLIIRYRRAATVERLQLKWFVCSIVAALLLVGPLSSAARQDLFTSIGLTLLPISIAVAIQRYRLYDIDKIVSRTIAYVLVVGLLLGTYLLIVLAFSTLSPLPKDSPLVVAISTLIVAALFRPLLGRIRREIDRRFNRTRYDAARTLESFSQRLRSEIDIDQMSQEMLTVVSQTVQPRALSLWLRPGSAGDVPA